MGSVRWVDWCFDLATARLRGRGGSLVGGLVGCPAIGLCLTWVVWVDRAVVLGLWMDLA